MPFQRVGGQCVAAVVNAQNSTPCAYVNACFRCIFPRSNRKSIGMGNRVGVRALEAPRGVFASIQRASEMSLPPNSRPS